MKCWKPRLYQIIAFGHMIKYNFAGLLLEPGLGKTSVSLFAIKCLKRVGKIKGVLIIVPLRPLYNVWLGENKKWLQFNKLKIAILHGENKEKALKSKADIYLINPEGLQWLKTELLQFRKWPFTMLIVDESTKFKNPQSKRFKYLLKPMLRRFKRRYILTGTPTPKSLLDMFTQTMIVDGGKALGTRITTFKSRYFTQTGYKGYELKLMEGCDKRIRKKIQHLMLVMKAEDYLSLPKLVFNDVYVDLPPKARKAYNEMEAELFAEFDDYELRAANCAVKFDKCHQMANGAIYHDQDMLGKPVPSHRREFHIIHQAKLEALKDLHEELQFKPILVAYKYQHDLKTIFKFMGKKKIPYIGSGVSIAAGSKIEKDWNAGKLSMLLGQPQSMAHGMNLQEAGNDVCYFSLDSNLDDHEQFYRRVYRSGVKGKAVRVHRIIARDTVDELIVARLEQRGNDQVSFKDALIKYRNKKMKHKS